MYFPLVMGKSKLLLGKQHFHLYAISNMSLGIMSYINRSILTKLARSRLLASSLSVSRGKPAQCFNRWDEVISTTDRCRISGQGITYAILCSRHTPEHAGQA